ncbi:hypothetical protein [Bacillus pacificus]|uniref:hypothetical protein n=1 Tax=Bacillus pacificus TaxID=2026187 RepID=UPI00156B3B86|nr:MULTISPECIES: hypothetical protein [Bacillus cereus group]MDA2165992.1 hypothetical protein [Bacillus cereus]NRR16650.1 hypothetical protein [Bacillus pacificus]
MKRVMYVVLLLSFVIGMTACNDETSQSRTLLSDFNGQQDPHLKIQRKQRS